MTHDEHNRGGMIAFLFCMVFTVCFFIYFSFIHEGVKIDDQSEEATQESHLDKPSNNHLGWV